MTKTRLCPQGTLCAKQDKVGIGSGGSWGIVGMESPLSPMEDVTRKALTQFWALPFVWPGLPFSSFPRASCLSWLSHILQLPPKPALQSDESSRVCGRRWTLWSQVRVTQGPSWPLRHSPSLCSLASRVFVCSCVYLLFRGKSRPSCSGAHTRALPSAGRSPRALSLACACFHILPQVLPFQPPFSLASKIYIKR